MLHFTLQTTAIATWIQAQKEVKVLFKPWLRYMGDAIAGENFTKFFSFLKKI
jgi:hypothetical protein